MTIVWDVWKTCWIVHEGPRDRRPCLVLYAEYSEHVKSNGADQPRKQPEINSNQTSRDTLSSERSRNHCTAGNLW